MKIRSRRAALHRALSLLLAANFAIAAGFLAYKLMEWRAPEASAAWQAAAYAGVAALAAWLYYMLHRKYIRRARLMRRDFPENWRNILNKKIEYYRTLGPEDQKRFERELQFFLAEKKIHGSGVEVEEEFRVLVAASAVIPAFRFPDWQYDAIGTIFVYPGPFDESYSQRRPQGTRVMSGLVGNERMYNAMILSKPDILRDYNGRITGRNVAVHEFAHLVDKGDGAIDGVPAMYLTKAQVGLWQRARAEAQQKIRAGESFIDRYALHNSAEFFAVTSEYFFTFPALLRREHPEVYDLLKAAYLQDPFEQLKDAPQTGVAEQWFAYRQARLAEAQAAAEQKALGPSLNYVYRTADGKPPQA